MAHSIPFSCLSNPQIMKIMSDSYGTLNQKFNVNQIQSRGNVPAIPSRNFQYILSGDKFVPVEMDIDTKRTPMMKNCRTEFNESLAPRNTFQSASRSVKNNKNSSMLMPLPVPLSNRDEKLVHSLGSNYSTSQIFSNEERQKLSSNSQRVPVQSDQTKNYQAKKIFFIGTIDRILKWNRNLEDVFCMYEVIAPIVSLQEGRIKNQKIMLLRDKKGPILQVQYYTNTHININDFHIGQYLRCVGRMIGFNILSAESIREATENEKSTLARLSYVCDYSVTHNLKKA